MEKIVKKSLIVLLALLGFLLFLQAGAKILAQKLENQYQNNLSSQVTDRNGKTIFIKPNSRGYYAVYSSRLPQDFEKLIVKKEDRFFYWHFGINPVSAAKALGGKIGLTDRSGSSTITQQLAKILLLQENERTAKNKLRELVYALALEAVSDKNEILERYANSAYFGNQLQGFETASRAYFGVTSNLLSKEGILQILAGLSNPNAGNPANEVNIALSKKLAKNLGAKITENNFLAPGEAKRNLEIFISQNKPLFELNGYLDNLPEGKIETATIDKDLNEKIREIVKRNIDLLAGKKAKNAAVVILRLPDNEILSLIGSPDPNSYAEGYQINMINKPRQVGSTIKPFIYLKGFEKGMRPYTIIDDREYKYPASEGFDIYPKNYDRLYHGKMTAHYALANSINVCAVKTLEYVGIDNFKNFLIDDLGYAPVQDFSNYQLGIALGALEMDLLNLSRDFTIFPNNGALKNLILFSDGNFNARYFPYQNKTAAQIEYVELVNKILSDRIIAQDQFGAQSSLNLPFENYALKTGTSHDYTDSWVIGYTPDFLVGVWVGNADNSTTEGLSGQLGAGLIWSDVMQLLLNSPYNKKTLFDFSGIAEYSDNGIQYGLKNDDYQKSKNVIELLDSTLILKPHNGDVFLFEQNAQIILQAKTDASWLVNGEHYGNSKEMIFAPPSPGVYEIIAQAAGQTERVKITVKSSIGASSGN